MSLFKQQSSKCEKHRKEHSILVVGEAKYICEECALFEQQYRGKRLMEKESVAAYGEMVERRCRELAQKGKTVEVMKKEKLVELVECVEELRDRMVNDISSQFAQIKQCVSAIFITKLQQGQKQKNSFQTPLFQILSAKTLQTKIMLQNQYQQKLQNSNFSLTKQITKIQQAFKTMKDELQHGVTFNIRVKDSFGFLFEKGHINQKLTKNLIDEQQDMEENLLDFSQFNIVQLPSYVTEPTFAKKTRVERMKTAACLEDSISICSIESMTKSTQLTLPHIALSIFQPSQSLLSDRSISCSSTISRKQIVPIMPKPSTCSSKNTLQIFSASDLTQKLSSIPPTVKTIRLSDLATLTNQDLLTLLRQKLSRSFIHTLQLVNCSKLTEKALVDLKTFKCKTLKKLLIKQCKQIKLEDKKVKEIVKRLESDGVKVLF